MYGLIIKTPQPPSLNAFNKKLQFVWTGVVLNSGAQAKKSIFNHIIQRFYKFHEL